MRVSAAALGIVLAASPAAAAGKKTPAKRSDKKMAFELTSPSFKHKDPIPGAHACDGKDLSPKLMWTEPPKGTRAFALVMDDPDAPPGTWVHWVLYDLPGSARGLDAGLARDASLAVGAKQGRCWGVDSFSRTGYYGPCPPPGKPHRYFFKLYALDDNLGLAPEKADKPAVERALKGHVLGQAQLIGTYKR